MQENDDSPKTKYGRKVQKPVLFTPEAKKSQQKRSLSNKSTGKELIFINILVCLFTHSL